MYQHNQQKIFQEKKLLAQVIDKKQKTLLLNLYSPYAGKLFCFSRSKKMSPGDKVKLKNITLRIPQNNPNFTDYLIKENILAITNLKKQNVTTLPNKNWLLAKRHELYTRLQAKIPPRPFAYFSSIFLGNKTKQPPRDNFYYFGTAHHLARSGLHVALFVLLWTVLLWLIPLPRILKHLILVALCLTYAVLSWTSTSFIRAIGIFLLYQLGAILNKQTNLLYLLQLIAFVILLTNPINLFFLDFQLSFGLTAALAWFFQPKTKRRKPPKIKAKTPIPCTKNPKFSNIK